MFQLSSDSEFQFEILRALSLAPYEGADVGEILVVASEIEPGDFESFYTAFNSLAIRVENMANAIDRRKYPVSARQAFFRAATYYRSADFFLHGNWTDPRIYSLWDKQLNAFNAALSLLPVPGKRVTLDAEDCNFTIPTIFFQSHLPGPRPTIIMCSGYDGSQEELYHVFGKGILDRGINVISYEGPGQPTVRRNQKIGFIPQWEKVVTPVINYALTIPDVDHDAIGLLGDSFGGYLAPRAAAFDNRPAALFAVDGVYDFGAALLGDLPPSLSEMFKSGNATQFNEIVNSAVANSSSPSALRWAVQQGMWAFNADTPFKWLTKAQEYTLANVTQDIRIPSFVAQAQDDTFTPGQGKLLADHMGKYATLHLFKSIDGAGEHSSVGASVLQNQVILDWFEETVQKRNGRNFTIQ